MITSYTIHMMKVNEWAVRKMQYADEKDIVDKTDRRPRPDTRVKVKWTPLSLIMFARNFIP